MAAALEKEINKHFRRFPDEQTGSQSPRHCTLPGAALLFSERSRSLQPALRHRRNRKMMAGSRFRATKRERIVAELEKLGFKVKKVGG